ncbi:hypothetical protein R3P38DRAFT_2937519 [Favolaschia claudopus]|uniref:MYND-type domain-containing protein n=1 Tax=Favolaschia claudopus TaxID=2862362 RepID=A0AAW0BQ46_9AGAR
MHASLKLSNLSRLPFSLKTRAQKVSSASLEQAAQGVQKFCTDLPTISSDDRPFLLPLFSTFLDPLHIPATVDQLRSTATAAQTDDIRNRVLLTIYSLQSIQALLALDSISLQALPDLWATCIWPWISFLDSYSDNLPECNIPATTKLSTFATLINFFANDVGKEIFSSPGVFAVVGRTWAHLLHSYKSDDDAGIIVDEALSDISQFITQAAEHIRKHPDSLDDLGEGAGGLVSRLPSMVVSHLRHFIPHSDTVVTKDIATSVCGMVPFFFEDIQKHFPAFSRALLSCGAVPALITVLRAFGPDRMLVEQIFALSVVHISYFPRHRSITEALRAGLFPALFSYDTGGWKGAAVLWLKNLLSRILPASTIYRSTLVQLRLSLAERDRWDAASTFTTDHLADWNAFLELANSRFQILNDYDSGILKAPKMCDNMQCMALYPDDDIQACSGCRLFRYCSKDCQLTNWRNDHRWVCAPLSSHRNDYSTNSARDKSFLRALLHHEYTTHREIIAREYLRFALEYPDLIPVLVFGYIHGACSIEVDPLTLLINTLDFEAARAVTRDGRIQYQIMAVMNGEKPSCLLFPFRGVGRNFLEQLRAYAASLPLDGNANALGRLDEYLPVVLELMQRE